VYNLKINKLKVHIVNNKYHIKLYIIKQLKFRNKNGATGQSASTKNDINCYIKHVRIFITYLIMTVFVVLN